MTTPRKTNIEPGRKHNPYPLSRYTRRTVALYGEDVCRRAYKLVISGASCVEHLGPYFGLSTIQSRGAVNAGRELETGKR